jgi:predicted Rossmann fold flavoprotein
VSLPVELRAERGGRPVATVAGDFLFTHSGFSGPAALDISRHFAAPAVSDTTLLARWGGIPTEIWETALGRDGPRPVAPLVREHLPRRLAALLLERAGIDEVQRRSTLTRDKRLRLLSLLTGCPLAVSGNEGYRTAEVTAGGIPLEEAHTRSLESRRVPGLYLCGEVLDATGKLGGYNFLWAWVSGRRVGLSVPA